MAEINNNIPKFGYNIEKIDNSKNKTPDINHVEVQAGSEEKQYVPDTGILGRSQIKNPKGSDVTRSVDETIALCEKYPQIMECGDELFDTFGDELFDTLYEQFLADGMDASEAYTKASLAMEEFVEIGKAQLSKNLD